MAGRLAAAVAVAVACLLALAPAVAATVSFQASQSTVLESAIVAVAGLSCDGSVCADATCDLVASGDAVAGQDFQPLPSRIQFSAAPVAGARYEATVVMQLINDGTPEPPESIIVSVANCASADQSTPILIVLASHTATILDDDVAPFQITFQAGPPPRVREGAAVDLIVLKTGGTPGIDIDVAVSWTVIAGAASAADVANSSGTLVIPAGSTQATLTFAAVDDAIPEGDETFAVDLSAASPPGYAQTNATVVVTIPENDDYRGVFSFAAPSLAVATPRPAVGQAGSVVLDVARAVGSFGGVVLQYAVTGPGAALLASPLSGNVAFVDGQVAAQITLAILPTATPTHGRTLAVTLVSAPATARLADSDTAAEVYIEATGFPAGSLGFRRKQRVVADEDTGFGFLLMSVTRESGTLGEVSVAFAAADPSGDLSGTSGFVLLKDGEATADFTIAVVNDATPELQEDFNVSLSSATGGATLDPARALLQVSVRESDDPRGAVQFEAGSRARDVAEPAGPGARTEVTLTLERLGGAIGAIEVAWAVTALSGVNSDVVPTAGVAQFAENQRLANISLDVLGDELPENAEAFLVDLVSATSGVRLVAGGKQSVVTVPTNDDAVMFVGNPPVVSEAPRFVSLFVTRTGDADDALVVDYVIESADATLDADYRVAAGALTFGVGQKTVFLRVRLLDDAVPERDETLTVRLVRLTGDAVLNPAAATTTITIQDNDNPAGAFGFANGSLARVLDELATDVNLTVSRSALSPSGAFGRVVLAWNLTSTAAGGAAADFAATTGSLAFAEGQAQGVIRLRLRDDATPELLEVFSLELAGPPGVLVVPGAATATLSVRANDNPHGVVELGPAGVALAIDPANATRRLVTVPLVREFGLHGAVLVSLALAYSGANSPFPSSTVNATLADGQGAASLVLEIPALAPLDVGAVLGVALTNVTLLGPLAAGASALAQPVRLGATTTGAVTVPEALAIGSLGLAPGVGGGATVAPARLRVAEETDRNVTVPFDLVRSGGSFGAATVSWRLVDTATSMPLPPGPEFLLTAGQEAFAPGQTVAPLELVLLDDAVPELLIAVTLEVVAVQGLGALDPERRQTFIDVLPSDSPLGVFQFAPASRGPLRTSEGALLRLDIAREGTALQTAVVRFTVSPTGRSVGPPSADFSQLSGVLFFPPATPAASIVLSVAADGLPEPDEAFVVALSSDNADLGAFPNTTVTIGASDDAFGVFRFLRRDDIAVDELRTGPNPFLTVVSRDVAAFGAVQLPFRVLECDPAPAAAPGCSTASPLATADIGPAQGNISFADGQTQAILSLDVLPDLVSEGVEVFAVVLDAPIDGRLNTSVLQQVRVAVDANDDPVGFDAASLAVAVTETAGVGRLTVTRGGVAQDRVEIAYAASNVYAPQQTTVSWGANITGANLLIRVGDTVLFTNDQGAQADLVAEGGLFSASLAPGATFEFTFDAPGVVAVSNGQPAAAAAFVSVVCPSGAQRTPPCTTESDAPAFAAASGLFEFAPGARTFDLLIPLAAPSATQPERQFQVALQRTALSGNSVVVPGQATAIVSVLADAGAGGVVELGSTTQIALAETNSSVAAVALNRTGNVLASVVVAWSVTCPSGLEQLSPSAGTSFIGPGVARQVVDLSVVDDAIPELDEACTFAVTGIKTIGSLLGQGRLAASASQLSVGITVLENDDASGVIAIANASRQILVSEGQLDTPFAVAVERAAGTFRTVSAVWVLQLDTSPPLPPFVDLGLAGARTGVNEVVRPAGNPGPGTERPALQFDGATSLLSLPVAKAAGGPLSVSLWAFQLAPGIRELVDVSVGPTRVRVVLDPLSGTGQLLITGAGVRPLTFAPASAALNQWVHVSLALDPALRLATVYVGGAQVAQASVTLPSQLGPVVSIGRSWLGYVSNAWIFEQALSVPLAAELGLNPAARDFVWTSGLATFLPGTAAGSIPVSVRADTIPELDELASLRLRAVSPEARLDTARDTAAIVVGLNDDPFGVFALSDEVVDLAVSEGAAQTLAFAVVRAAGSIGDVVVQWAVTACEQCNPRTAACSPCSPAPSPAQDFAPLAGSLEFEDGQRRSTFAVAVVNDDVPELTRRLTVSLLAASQGARVTAKQHSVVIAVNANDDPFGVFAFSPLGTVDVSEGGVVEVPISRARGTFGVSTVTVAAAFGSADAADVAPFAPVVFSEGSATAVFRLNATADGVPEFAETLQLQLQAVDAGAIDRQADRRQVVIAQSDDPNGVIAFAAGSQARVLREANVSTTVQLDLVRTQGTFGTVSTFYSIAGAGALQDLGRVAGEITFGVGQRNTALTLTLAADDIPEVAEVFTVTLLNATGGARLLPGGGTSVLTVAANDNPHGAFAFAPGSVMASVAEPASGTLAVQLTIVREFGDFGEVTVLYQSRQRADLQARFAAQDSIDYTAAATSVVFLEGETAKTITIGVHSDDIPELAERFDVAIVQVVLSSQASGPYDGASPSIGAQSVATVEIQQNNEPFGVIEFDFPGPVLEVPEDGSAVCDTNGTCTPNRVVLIRRTLGTFGEARVTWGTTFSPVGGARPGLDFTPAFGVAVLPDLVGEALLDLAVLDDATPELSEQFQVQLVSVVGGGRLSARTQLPVRIADSDDPYGRIGFAAASLNRTLAEPQANTTVEFVLLRGGGSIGVQQVFWATSGAAAASFQPAAGVVTFQAGETNRTFSLAQLADARPEVAAELAVTLSQVLGSAVLDPAASRAIVVEPASDDPHGVFEWAPTALRVAAAEGDTVSLALARLAGTAGAVDLQVVARAPTTDELLDLDLTTSAAAPVQSLRASVAFEPPALGTAGAGSVVIREFGPVAVARCLVDCLRTPAAGCQAASYDKATFRCRLLASLASVDAGVAAADTYRVRAGGLARIDRFKADAPGDASPAGTVVRFPEGEAAAAINLTVAVDAAPELDEVLAVEVTAPSLATPQPGPTQAPRVGTRAVAFVTVAASGDPLGIVEFGTEASSATATEPSLITLVFLRSAGTFGDQTASWRITAGAGAIAGGVDRGTVTFAEGDGFEFLRLRVNDDAIPELDETVTFELLAVAGGARLGPAAQHNVTVLANDDVNGVVSLDPAVASRGINVTEGADAGVAVLRNVSLAGTIAVRWALRGLGAASATAQFAEAGGVVVFGPGVALQTIVLAPLNDTLPEREQAFALELVAVESASDGAGSIDPALAAAGVLLLASDNPYGAVGFASLTVFGEEGGEALLELTRSAALGRIGVVYETFALQAGSGAATPGADYAVVAQQLIVLGQGTTSATLRVALIDDATPEFSESFGVRIVSATLMDGTVPALGGASPTVAPGAGSATVVINANDDAAGVFSFAIPSDQLVVAEASTDSTLLLNISRTGGALGPATLAVATSSRSPPDATVATPGADYSAVSTQVTFADGEREKSVAVVIRADTLPELGEDFQVALGAPSSGTLGSPNLVSVTIAPSDDPAGSVALGTGSVSVTAAEGATLALDVLRGPGTFGAAQVSWRAVGLTPGADPAADLSASSGVVLLGDGQGNASISISVVDDQAPERAERFAVELFDAVGTTLAAPNRSLVDVPASADAFGVLEFARVSQFVAEGAGTALLAVERGGGAFGEVTVAWQAQPLTASYVSPVQNATVLAGQPRTLQAALGGAQQCASALFRARAFVVLSGGSAPTRLFRSDAAANLRLVEDLAPAQHSAAALVAADGATLFLFLATAPTADLVALRYDPAGDRLAPVAGVPAVPGGVQALFHFVAADGRPLLAAGGLANTTVFTVSRAGLAALQVLPIPAQAMTAYTVGSATFLAVAPAPSDPLGRGLTVYTMADGAGLFQLAASEVVFTAGLGQLASFVTGPGPTPYILAVVSNSPTASGVLQWQPQGQPSAPVLLPSTAGVDAIAVTTVGGAVVLATSRADGIALFRWEAGGFVGFNTDPAATPSVAGGLTFAALLGTESSLLSLTGGSLDARLVSEVDAATDAYPVAGTLVFPQGSTSQTIQIEVVDDATPELDELFQVTLSAPTGGALLGAAATTSTTILANDDPNGVLQFALGSRARTVAEAVGANATVTLVVERTGGAFGLVTVDYAVTGGSAGDVVPRSGQLQFPAGVRSAQVQLAVVADAAPELDEVFSVGLLPGTIRGGARVAAVGGSALVTVPSNDDVHGLFLLSAANVTAPEDSAPVLLDVLRVGGTVGEVAVTFALGGSASPGDYNLSTSELLFADGVTARQLQVQIVDDAVPEGPEVITVALARAMLTQAVPGSSQPPAVAAGSPSAAITVPANDGGSGSFSFATADVPAEEGERVLVDVVRGAGAFGAVLVDWSVVNASGAGLASPAQPADYSVVSTGTLRFGSGQTLAQVVLDIVADGVPELEEALLLRIDRVSGGLPDSPPTIGATSEATVRIGESDDARGLLEFSVASLNLLAAEGDSLNYTVRRLGGTFGELTVQWTVTDAQNATSIDFAASSGTLVFPDGSSQEQVFVLDSLADRLPEEEERFTVALRVLAGGARVSALAGRTTLTLSVSDDANGVFGMAAPVVVLEELPGRLTTNLVVQRRQGLFGTVVVMFSLGGICPAGDMVCQVDHPSASDFAASQAFAGSLTFQPGQSQAVIPIELVNDADSEGEETFTVTLALQPGSLDARLDALATTADVRILPSDDGNGILSFDPSSVRLAAAEGDTVTMIVLRTIGVFGTVSADYRIVPVSGNSSAVATEFSNPAGRITFQSFQTEATFSFGVVQDAVPELQAEYRVELFNPLGGVQLSSTPFAALTVAASDDPHGLLRPANAAIVADPADVQQRTVTFEIQRAMGLVGNISVDFTVARMAQGSLETNPVLALCSLQPCSRTLVDGQQQLAVRIAVPADAFLEAGDQFEVTITAAALAGAPLSPSQPRIDALQDRITASVGQDSANNVITLAPLNFRGTEGQTLNLEARRSALAGNVSFDWRILDTADQVASAHVQPSSGSAVMGVGSPSAALPITLLDDNLPEPAAVLRLMVSNLQWQGNALKTRATELQFLIEESDDPRGLFGVVQPAQPYAEGAGSIDLVVQRQRGVAGNVVVLLEVTAGSALVGADFTVDWQSHSGALYVVAFADGEAERRIPVLLVDDDEPELSEAFGVRIVNVTTTDLGVVLPPRVDAAAASATITIAESDDPFGRFSFERTEFRATEEDSLFGSPRMFNVRRLGGSFGSVAVAWTVSPSGGTINPGISGDVDFSTASPSLLTFGPGETSRNIAIRLNDDLTAEPEEAFVLALANPTGGAVLGSNASTTVRIAASDVPGGTIGFALPQRTVSESDGEVALTLTRSGGAFEAVELLWTITPSAGSAFSAADVVALNGSVTIPVNATSHALRLALVDDAEPELAEAFEVSVRLAAGPASGAELDPTRSRVTVTIGESDSPFGVLGFPCEDRFGGSNVDGRLDSTVVLTVMRSGGTRGRITVGVRIGPYTSNLALTVELLDEVVTFEEGIQAATVTLRATMLTSGIATLLEVPVLLVSPTGGAEIDPTAAASTVTVYESETSRQVLLDRQAIACRPQLYLSRVATRTGGACDTPYSASDIRLLLASVSELTAQGPAATDEGGLTAESRREVLLRLFADLLNPACDGGDTILGEAGRLLEQYTAELAATVFGANCPEEGTVRLGDDADQPDASISLIRTAEGSDLNGLTRAAVADGSGVNHSYSLPQALFPTPSGAAAQCGTLRTIQYSTAHWFRPRGAYYNEGGVAGAVAVRGDWAVMHDRVVSVNLPAGTDPARISASDPIRFSLFPVRNHPTEEHFGERICVSYSFDLLGDAAEGWSTAGCLLRGSPSGDGAVECECSHATHFAVLVPRRVERSLSTAAKVALFLLLIVSLVVLVLQRCRPSLTAHLGLVLQLLLAVLLTALLMIVSCFAAADASEAGCFAVGFVAHYFYLAQFAWLLAIALHVRAFVVPAEDPEGRWMPRYYLVGWGAPFLLAVVYLAAHQGATGEDLRRTYGDVTGHGELCFIPDSSVGGLVGAAFFPALLGLLALLYVCYEGRRHTKSWATYNDFNEGRINEVELRVLCGLALLLFAVWMFAALDVLVGSPALPWLFVVVVVAFCLYLLWFYALAVPRARRDKVDIAGETSTTALHLDATGSSAATGRLGSYSLGPGVGGTELSLMPQTYRGGLGSPPHGNERRAAFPSYHEGQDGLAAAASPADYSIGVVGDDDDFDDLLFALRTGRQLDAPGETNVDLYGDGDGDEGSDGDARAALFYADEEKKKTREELRNDPELLELRRLSLQDTHL